MSDFRSFNQEYYSDYTRVQRLRLKRRRKGRVFFSLLFLMAFLGALGYGTFVYADDIWVLVAKRYFHSRINTVGAAEPPKDVPGEEPPRHLNILLLGVDQRKNEPARSDTLMVAMLDLHKKTVDIISIPRDTRVKIEGLKYKTRINHALPNGGIDLTRKTVEELLGIPVHNYVQTNFKGFENIIDLLGGVTFTVEKRMYYPAEDINLYKGLQRLDGHDALAYVRYRSDGKGDLPRIERQHKFLSALAAEVLKPKTILKLPKLAGKLHDNVETDMSVGDILVLSGEFKSINPETINFHDLPGVPKYIGGASYFEVDEAELQLLIDKILSGNTSETHPDTTVS